MIILDSDQPTISVIREFQGRKRDAIQFYGPQTRRKNISHFEERNVLSQLK
jgi:hypothetical protein